MKVTIDPAILVKFPGLVLGVATISGADNTGGDPAIQTLLRAAEQRAIDHLGSLPLVEHPHISAWREVYRLFGAKPKKYQSSIENLLRRVLAGEPVRHINPLVDIYNIISLKYFVPVGGEDLAQIKGDVQLTFATPDEAPVQLLGEPEARPPHPDEVIYKDDIGTVCRRWNWKEADRTKLTDQTTAAIIVIEGLPPVDSATIELALADLKQLVTKFCGGTVESDVLNLGYAS